MVLIGVEDYEYRADDSRNADESDEGIDEDLRFDYCAHEIKVPDSPSIRMDKVNNDKTDDQIVNTDLLQIPHFLDV